ncbi:N-acetyl-gamma-glutamyl-phosphate reductase [Bacillus salitolerans]|uniref:N-acetyl-gamma-glutamyl-phosphate reductase n=1 Tax=Bacillus salitolerans TaxID=1437434 RepID=A0ABW4LX58_9BACI
MKAAVIGGTGYSAIELIRLLHHHPYAHLDTIVSHSNGGTELHEIYPHVTNLIDTPLQALDIKKLSQKIQVVFFATPSGVSKEMIPAFLDEGIRCIDLSGDFRLRSQQSYEKWYRHQAAEETYLKKAVYGLSEINEAQIKGSTFISNPGCYPTATLLALIPALQLGFIDQDNIIIDAKSGVSGAGRGLSLATHYGEVNENVKAYKLGAHQHIPEIEQTLQTACHFSKSITFTTHLVPMTRGIMCTIYTNLTKQVATEDITLAYTEYYQDHPFVRIRPSGTVPATKEVYGSNFCDIGFHADERTGKLTIVSVIDNLIKGASGQAIQNLNLMNGWDVRTGLLNIPLYP